MTSFLTFLLLGSILTARAQDYGNVQFYEYDDQTDSPLTTPTSSNFGNIFGFNIAGQIRQSWEDIREKILLMSQHEKTRGLVQEMVDVIPCVSNLEGFLAFLEQGTQLIDNNSSELENIIITLLSLRGERNITILSGKSADILLILDGLYPKLRSYICQKGPEQEVAALRDLALVLYKMSLVEDIPNLITQLAKQNFLRAAQIIEALSNVGDNFRKNSAEQDCYTSKDSLKDFIILSSETINDLGQAVGALGYFQEAKEVRQYSSFVRSLVDSVGTLEEFRVPGDCSAGSLGRASNTIKELSGILGEVSLEALSVELGVSFRLDLLP